jgi:hypothetical protein
MNAATPHNRGLTLILEHCARLAADESRTPASSRLEQRAGRDLARMLIKALARDHGRARTV